MGKLKQAILDILPNMTIKTYRRDKNSMRLIKWNVRFLLFCYMLYIVMTIYEWWRTGIAGLADFQKFILICGGLVPTYLLLSKWLIDKGKDGRSDEGEKDNSQISIPNSQKPIVKNINN